MDKASFLSRAQTYPVIWAAILSVISFFSGKIYESNSESPVIKIDTKTEDSALNVKIVENKVKNNDEVSKEDIEKLTLAINEFNKSAYNSETNAALKLLSYEIRNFNNSLDKNRPKEKLNEVKNSISETSSKGEVGKKEEYIKTPIVNDIEFELPKSAEGYSPEKIKGIKNHIAHRMSFFKGCQLV